MSGARGIRTKIASIKNTQKITRAMEMVAASKMRRVQAQKERSRPYAKKIRQVIGHLAKSNPEYRHPFLTVRDIKRVGIIVVSTDRGLCGGLNSSLFRKTISEMRSFAEKNIEIDLCVIGRKGEAFFRRAGGKVIASRSHLGDSPKMLDLIGVVKVMLDAFDSGEIDAIYIATNDFVNTMVQQPVLERLLPLVPDEDDSYNHHWDYIYEPEAKALLDTLLRRYVESQVYQAVIENNACEQAARMVAMKSASDNAGKVIDELQLVYNKARQAAITQELSEIVAGANAV